MHVRGLTMPLATYQRRRVTAAKLVAQAIGERIPLLFIGCDESTLRRDRQDPWFDYYSGCAEPEAALLIDGNGKSTLFLEPGDPAREVWDGKRLKPDDEGRAAHGVDAVLSCKQLMDTVIAAAHRAGGRIGMCHRTKEPGFQAKAFTQWKADLAGQVLIANIEAPLVRQRMIKEPGEIAWHRKAIAITWDGLRQVLPQLKRLKTEAEVATLLTMHYRKVDYGPLAFPPIIGSAVNGATLHYPHNDRPLVPNAPILIDSGATAGGYCADVTRTVPVHGRFDDKRFRDVYELVLAANQRACKILKPGMTHKEWTEMGWKGIVDAQHIRHHGLGHHIGLDVHDPADYDVPLQPGMILSNEPGIYLPEEGFGIRIEDDLLVTKTGCEVLTRAIPKTVADLEAAMRG